MNKTRLEKILLVLSVLMIFPAFVSAQPPDAKLEKADALVREAGTLIEKKTYESSNNAIAKTEEAVKIFEELKNADGLKIATTMQGLGYQSLGILYLNDEKPDEAAENFNKALDIFRKTDFKPGIAETLHNLGVIAVKKNDDGSAVKFYEQAISVYLSINQTENAAIVLKNLGYLYLSKEDYEKSLLNFGKSLELGKKSNNRADAAEILEKTGDIYFAKSEFDEAEKNYLEALPIYKTLQNPQSSVVLQNLGIIAFERKQPDKALDYYEQSLEIYRSYKDVNGEFSVLSFLGERLINAGKNELGVKYLTRAALTANAPENAEKLANVYFNLGTAYQNLFDYEKSLKNYKKSLEISEKLGQPKDTISVINRIAVNHSLLYEYEKANEFYERELQIGKTEGLISSQILGLTGLAKGLYKLNQPEKSEQYLAQAAALSKRIEDENFYAAAFSAIGRTFSERKEYVKAREFLTKALQMFENIEDKESQAFALFDLGYTYYSNEQFEVAGDYFRRVETLAREMENYPLLGFVYISYGELSYAKNDFREAAEFYKDALEIAGEKVRKNTGRNPANTGGNMGLGIRAENINQAGLNALKTNAWFKLGAAQNESGEYENALVSLGKSLDLARAAKNKNDEMSALSDIATSLSELGKYAESLEANNRALQISREIRDLYAESVVLNNLGIAYLRLGSFEKAEDYVNQSAKIVEKLDEPRLTAQAEANLGAVYARLRQFDKALSYFDLALPKLRAQKNNRFIVITSYYNGAVLRETGKLENAVKIHTEAVEAAKTVSAKFEAAALIELGYDFIEQKKFGEAVATFEKALNLAQIAKTRDEQSAAFGGLMQAWQGLGKTSKAIFYGKQAVNLLQETRTNAAKLGKDVQTNFLKNKKEIYTKLADLLIAEGRLPEAQTVLAMLKEKEYSEFITRDADEAASLAKISERPDEKEALEKYGEYSKTLASDGAELVKLEEKKNNLKDGEAFAEQARYDELKTRIEATNKAFRILLEKTLAKDIDKNQIKDIKQDRALQGKLAKWGDGTVALYTLIAEDRYRVILTTPKVQIDGKTEIKAADLNKKISDFRQILLDPTLDPRPLGKELYDILVKPIEANLTDAKAKTLLWSLNGSLGYIPIGALYDGEKYLAEKYQNVIVTSTTRASLDEETSKDWRVLGAGVTSPSEVTEPFGTAKIPFNALPSVGEELQTIVKTDGGKGADGILPGLRLIDSTFTENALKENVAGRNAGERKYNVIHFATHFRLGNLPENSFLLLGNNEILTLEEVNDSTDLELTGIELVTLSACNTGFGGISGISEDNKAIDSLAAFIESRGAKSVIATLWAVNDESTALLMSEFYRLRKENPQMTKSEAMQTAQKMMIGGELKPLTQNKRDRSGVIFKNDNTPNAPKFVADPNKPFAHPLYWSPFVLIGNWR